MQSSQENRQTQNPSSESRPFAPFVAKTLEVQGDYALYHDVVSYNEKHNLIIACPPDKSLRFYDATTLLPSKEFKTLKLEDNVHGISFFEETETFLFGCRNGVIYTFNLSNEFPEKLKKSVKGHIAFIIWMNSSYYAWSAFGSYQLHVGNLQKGNLLHFSMEKSDVFDLKSLPKRNLLFSSLDDGSVLIYRTDRLPKLPILDVIKGNIGRKLGSFTMNKKDFLLTVGADFTIELWHITKGKMRRVKVFQLQEELEVYYIVYLENYKIFATVHGTQEIRFFRLFSGKLERVLDVGVKECLYSFLMKDKNAIGVFGYDQNLVKIVQLG